VCIILFIIQLSKYDFVPMMSNGCCCSVNVVVVVSVCCSCVESSSDDTTTWRGVIESADTVGVYVGLFDSTFTVSCVDRSATVRTAKVSRAGE